MFKIEKGNTITCYPYLAIHFISISWTAWYHVKWDVRITISSNPLALIYHSVTRHSSTHFPFLHKDRHCHTQWLQTRVWSKWFTVTCHKGNNYTARVGCLRSIWNHTLHIFLSSDNTGWTQRHPVLSKADAVICMT